MSERVKFGIPSYHRCGKVTTVDYLLSAGVSPEDIVLSTQTIDDYEKYKKEYGGRCIVIYGEGDCVSDNRNNLLEYFEENTKLVMLDDDILFIGKKNGKKFVKMDDDEMKSFVEDAFNYCRSSRALIFTGYPVTNGMFMSNKIEKRQFGIGQFFGIITKQKYRFRHEYRIKEDIELCLRTMRDGYNCLRFDFVATQHRPNHAEGGCHDSWNDGSDSKCTSMLLKEYAGLIKKGSKENQVKMR